MSFGQGSLCIWKALGRCALKTSIGGLIWSCNLHAKGVFEILFSWLFYSMLAYWRTYAHLTAHLTARVVSLAMWPPHPFIQVMLTRILPLRSKWRTQLCCFFPQDLWNCLYGIVELWLFWGLVFVHMLGLIGSISVLEFDFSYIQIVACLSFACADIHHTCCPWNSLLRSLAQCWEDLETDIKKWPWMVPKSVNEWWLLDSWVATDTCGLDQQTYSRTHETWTAIANLTAKITGQVFQQTTLVWSDMTTLSFCTRGCPSYPFYSFTRRPGTLSFVASDRKPFQSSRHSRPLELEPPKGEPLGPKN